MLINSHYLSKVTPSTVHPHSHILIHIRPPQLPLVVDHYHPYLHILRAQYILFCYLLPPVSLFARQPQATSHSNRRSMEYGLRKRINERLSASLIGGHDATDGRYARNVVILSLCPLFRFFAEHIMIYSN